VGKGRKREMIQEGFKFGLGLLAAGFGVWIGGCVLVLLMIALFDNPGKGKD
jgi:hypothetical protein